MAEKAGKVSDGVQIPHADIAAQGAHFIHLLKSHHSVNRTPVMGGSMVLWQFGVKDKPVKGA
jgi:hypothetical protein